MTNAVIEPPPSFARWREARGVTERGKARKRFFHISSAPHTSRVPLSGKRLAFIGGGTMAEAMSRGLLDKHLVPPSHVLVTGPRRERRAELAKAYGVKALASNVEAAKDAHVVVLSVKPQMLPAVTRELSGKLDDENLVDLATALSGTGPTYVFLLMEALVDAGVHLGFSRRVAEELVLRTVEGSALFARKSGRHLAELRNMVTSPGGTSAAAIYQLEKGALRTVLSKAVYAAYKRTRELGAEAERRSREQ